MGTFVRPIQEFIETEAAGGIVLIAAAAAALLWANSPWSDAYFDLLHTHFSVDVGFFSVDEDLHFWVNDVAMVAFFFLVGLEIKRELATGELASVDRVVVPLVGAVGGMLLPIAIFLLVLGGDAGSEGWGVPMATDIAFALGLVALLGRRVPSGLQVLLLAIAIFDDIGTVVVIAIFYTDAIDWEALSIAVGALGSMILLNRAGVRPITIYVAVGVVAWAGMLESGVHTTIVGVVAGVLTPARSRYTSGDWMERMRGKFAAFETRLADDTPIGHEERVEAVLGMGDLGREALAPLDRLEHEIHPWVAFAVIPAFALANAGVELGGDTLRDAAASSLTWAITLGLVFGKPLGILAGVWLATRLGARLPVGVDWPGVIGVGTVAGIGFTVALFVSDLAYTEQALVVETKVGILAASLVAGTVGMALLGLRSTVAPAGGAPPGDLPQPRPVGLPGDFDAPPAAAPPETPVEVGDAGPGGTRAS